MHISYFGLSCFKIVAKTAGRGSDDVTILFAPFSSKTGLRAPQGKANIVFYPHTDEQFNGGGYASGEPVEIHMPGEYAAHGVSIIGRNAPADARGGQERGNTTVYVADIEDMKVVYLGAIGEELTPDMYDEVAGADILFLPIGDKEGIDGKTAETIARKIEAKVIIPMQYADSKAAAKNLRDEKDFCSNIGNCPKERLEKYVIKAADLENKAMEVVMLQIV